MHIEPMNSATECAVILTDDHTIVRHAVKTIVESDPAYKVVAEAERGDQTLQLVEEHQPSVVVLDISLPGKNGLETLNELRAKFPKTKVIILSMHEDEVKVRQALCAGASGYLSKACRPSEVLEALQTVRNNEIYLPPQFSFLKQQLDSLSQKSARADYDPLAKLSKREREIFFLLADGNPNRVIAKKLFLSPRTVETHRARVIKKLGFSSTADLIRFAIRNNLLSL